MKKFILVILAAAVLLSFCSCGIANGSHGGIVKTDEWPMTDYPAPEGAQVISSEKNYNGVTVGVVWDSMESAKAYTNILIEKCGKDDSTEPLVTENETEYSYSSYKFTVSYSKNEERLNYIHIY